MCVAKHFGTQRLTYPVQADHQHGSGDMNMQRIYWRILNHRRAYPRRACVVSIARDLVNNYGLLLCRKLGILRSSFSDIIWRGKKVRIPIMALTATATGRVRDDILKCLSLRESHPKIIVTSFQRPNLIFSVNFHDGILECITLSPMIKLFHIFFYCFTVQCCSNDDS